jgi:heterodisulfide reductase subunit C/quinone-modifying oxidoreductase subunit QmoC
MSTQLQTKVASPAAAVTGRQPPARTAAGTSALPPVAICLQCRKCSCGCPVAARADIKPHELVRLVQLGESAEAIASRMIWECTSCETCVTRCPQKVDIPALVDALRQMARAQGKVPAGTTVPEFNDIFLNLVRKRGRMYEAGLMAAFKLRTWNLFQDMDKFPMMLRKRKIALLPKNVRGADGRKRMFERVREAERKGQ